MFMWMLVLIVVFAGSMVPIQAGVNSQLAKYFYHPFQAAFISFLGGTLAMMMGCFLVGAGFPSPSKVIQVPPYLLTGGLLGSVMVMTAIILAPRLGAVVLIASSIAGQMLASIILDHYGWAGFETHPISFWRFIGILFLVVGVVLVRKF